VKKARWKTQSDWSRSYWKFRKNSNEEGLMEGTEQLEPGLLGIQKTSSEGGAIVNMYQLEPELEIQRNSSEGVVMEDAE
jgi:hypothetical protein